MQLRKHFKMKSSDFNENLSKKFSLLAAFDRALNVSRGRRRNKKPSDVRSQVSLCSIQTNGAFVACEARSMSKKKMKSLCISCGFNVAGFFGIFMLHYSHLIS